MDSRERPLICGAAVVWQGGEGEGGPWQSITLQPGGGTVWRSLATTPGGGKVNISLSGHEDLPEGLARRSLSGAAGPELPRPWPATSRPPHAAHATPPPSYRLPNAPAPRACQSCLGFCNYHYPVSAGGVSALHGVPNTLRRVFM